jgi:LL-diaminopimelate aminotransferase
MEEFCVKFAKRMDRFDTGIFVQLAAIKAERLKKGREVIDFSIGAPNIPPSKQIIDVMLSETAKPENHVYAIQDHPQLLDTVAAWYTRRYGVTLDPGSEIVSLAGSQEGFTDIPMAVVDPGDIVLVPDPCYPAFVDGPKLAGAQIFYMPMTPENGYIIDLDAIPEDIARKASLIIVNYPNNPTAAVAPPEFYHKLIAFARRYEICVLADNAYSDLVFDGCYGGSFLEYEGAREVGVEINSLSKTYGLAGARIGFCMGNRELIARIKKIKSGDYGMFIPFQLAAAAAISGDQSAVAATREAYQSRRDVLCREFFKIGWEIPKSRATMFAWAPLPAGYTDSAEFCKQLLARSGVLLTPGTSFGPAGEGHVRIALVRSEEEMCRAARLIRESGILEDQECRLN